MPLNQPSNDPDMQLVHFNFLHFNFLHPNFAHFLHPNFAHLTLRTLL